MGGVLFWAVLVVAFVIIEIYSVQLVSIWLAAGAFVTMLLVNFVDIPFWGQLAVFLVVSVVLIIATLPFVKEKRKIKHTPTNTDIDVGKSVPVIEDIDSVKGTGRITLNGVDWGAVSESGESISKGSTVTIVEVKGTKMVVKL